MGIISCLGIICSPIWGSFAVLGSFAGRDPYSREVKLDVYGKPQTAKMKLLPFLFSCVYSGVKLFVFAIKSRRRYSIFVWFIYGLEEKSLKAEVIFREVKHDVNGF